MRWTAVTGSRFVATWLLLSVAGGCSDSTESPPLDLKAIRELGDLPGVRQSSNAALREELAHVEEQGGTPGQLSVSRLADDKNAAVLLADVLDPMLAEALLENVESLFPPDRFEYNSVTLAGMIRLRRRYEPILQMVRKGLARDGCDFRIDFRSGYCADRSFLNVCTAYVSLEAFHVAELLAEDKPSDAVPHLRSMILLIGHLAKEKHVESRLTAISLRERALSVTQALVGHRQLTADELLAVYEIIQEMLAAWPYDGDAWRGDRAFGLHSYEAVRAGAIFSLLTAEELEQFRKEGILADLPAAAAQIVEQDELYYLQTMRRLIESCRKPFFERQEMFAELRKDLHARRNSPDFPLVAARLLLPDIENAHRLQAQDRARAEAWTIALALGARLKRPPYKTNPTTGKPYQVTTTPQSVSVWTGDPIDRPIIVPILDRQVARRPRS